MDNRTRFKPYQPNQLLFLPPDMKQWLPEGDLAYFIMDMVGQLDLSAIYDSYDGTKVKAKAQAKSEEIAEKERSLKEQGKKRKGKKPKEPSDCVDPKAQRNFTDPDSRIMKDGASKSFEQAYNCQAEVDSESQIIVAANVTQQANDKQQLEPLVEAIKDNTGGTKPEMLGPDTGYFIQLNIECRVLSASLHEMIYFL